MSYADLDGIHSPTAGYRPPASWGSQINANFDAIYDDVLAKLGAWTSFTPSFTQSGSITKTVNYAKYVKLGRIVIANAYVTATAAGTASNPVLLGLPVTAASSSIIAGSWFVNDGAATFYTGAASLHSTTAVGGLANTSTAYWGVSPAITIASGDAVLYHVVYESAS